MRGRVAMMEQPPFLHAPQIRPLCAHYFSQSCSSPSDNIRCSTFSHEVEIHDVMAPTQ
jgi:hypothetical protein